LLLLGTTGFKTTCENAVLVLNLAKFPVNDDPIVPRDKEFERYNLNRLGFLCHSDSRYFGDGLRRFLIEARKSRIIYECSNRFAERRTALVLQEATPGESTSFEAVATAIAKNGDDL